MKGISKILVVFILCFTVFVGCGSNDKKEEKPKEENITLNTIKEKDKDESNNLVNNVSNENVQKINTDKGIKEELFTIYDVDVNTYEKKTSYDFKLPSDKPMEDKAKIIVNKTREKYFKGLPIDVSFKKVENKDIMVLNLIEKNNITDKSSWNQIFQGSTGGTVNSTILLENSLQREYKGKWVDGVEILYNGKSCEFQHAEKMNDIVYR
ncbi:hypothetical protein [Clostridium hydrogeniformans]|uniref:hypothetical protein n=1 Tax=Clostridium hydrogeniformans TaxID=349933 RepID=UPI0004879878|nr:hypothetical protein [Clostridium hydrogeniformans]